MKRYGFALALVLAVGVGLGWTMNAGEAWLRGKLYAGSSKVQLTDATGNLSTTSGTYSGNVLVAGTLGVTGAVTLKDDELYMTSVTAGGTASTWSAQGTSGVSGLVSTFATQGTTVASAGDSYTLPPAVAGLTAIVCNGAAANAMDVFPYTSDQINSASADAAISLASGECMFCIAFTGVRWGCVIGSAT